MTISSKTARSIAKAQGLQTPLVSNNGRRLRFDFIPTPAKDAGCIVAKIKSAYTVGHGEIGELDKLVLKLRMDKVRGYNVHSIAFDLVSGNWTFYVRDGFEHPPYVDGNVHFIGDDGAEPEIENLRVCSVLHAAHLPPAPSLLLDAPFHFFMPSRALNGHYLSGVIESVEVSESSARLYVVAPSFVDRRIVSLVWRRGTNWWVELDHKGDEELMQGELDVDLSAAISAAQVVRLPA